MNRALPVVAVLLLATLAGALWWVFQPPENVPAPLPDSHAAPAAANADSGTGEAQNTAQTTPTIERVQAEDALTSGSDAERGLVQVLATWDGEPAAGVLVTLRWTTRERAHRVREQKHTDAEGRAVFADVPPGKWSLRSDRGDRKSIDVVPGPQDIAFELETGVTVTGVVVAPEDLPTPRRVPTQHGRAARGRRGAGREPHARPLQGHRLR